jgi:hypothetical protein
MTMTTVFIAGSMSIKHLHPLVLDRLGKIVDNQLAVVVGDADGVDTSIQTYLADSGHVNTTVFCTGEPRNNIGNWPTHVVESRHAKGTRAFFTAKDLAMAEAADYGLMIWDAKSTGTLSNVLELIARHKKTVVFINKAKQFKNIGSATQLEVDLLPLMSESALSKAEDKLALSTRVQTLKHEQSEMF